MTATETAGSNGLCSFEPKPWTAGEPVLDLDAIRVLELKLEEDGTSLFELMKRAGSSVATEAKKRCDPGARVVVLCGNGNNGGDAWVVAADLVQAGFKMDIVTAVTPEEIRTEPARSAALEAAKHLADGGDAAVHILPDQSLLESILTNAHAIVDGLLGTGFSGESVREPFATWITLTNKRRRLGAGLKTFSIDIPSGLSGQTGFAANPTIQADCTITMLAMKPGLLTSTGKTFCGTLLCAPLADIAPYLSTNSA